MSKQRNGPGGAELRRSRLGLGHAGEVIPNTTAGYESQSARWQFKRITSRTGLKKTLHGNTWVLITIFARGEL